jgi:hypothetical protein
MNLFSNYRLKISELFEQLYFAKTEIEIQSIIDNQTDFFKKENWTPVNKTENNYSIIENQQSSPIAALIEKITNSIDATLMKKCLEKKIDPESKDAPRSMSDAVELFYPTYKNWDLAQDRRKQAEEIQIIADGPTNDTSVIIYDNGEGQSPEKFESTFLSLARGNKNKIPFVQGKYNMGGSGSIVFCGRNGYQLIGSRRYDKSGDFGFTIIRQHPLTKEEKQNLKNTWYEYFTIEGEIPHFSIEELNLGLHNRTFKTGTIIKMYSYQFGKKYGFAQELRQQLTEYLFEPALPVLTKDTKERYPNNKVLEADLFGLKRRLESEENDYLRKTFVEVYEDELFYNTKLIVTGYVFKNKVKDFTIKRSVEIIQERYFNNNMSVLFSMNGQVHGHYTSEFITKSLKFNMLKKHLLLHVDCTHLDYDFRKELFMASRDRLKVGRETKALRDFLTKQLGKKDEILWQLDQERRNSSSFESGSASDLLKSFSKDIHLAPDLMKLLGQTFKLDYKEDTKKKQEGDKQKNNKTKQEIPFNPQRFPSFFKFEGKGNQNAISLPLNGEKRIQFDTDVEDNYFHRTEEPGELQVALIKHKTNETTGGDRKGTKTEISEVVNLRKGSPQNGKIRLSLNTEGKDLAVGDELEIKVSLEGSGPCFDQLLLVKIQAPNEKKEKVPQNEGEIENPGLPEFQLVYEHETEGFATWQELSIEMDAKMVMYPMATGEQLEKIYINMDSNVLKRFIAGIKNINSEQKELQEKKYISAVYFHTLFLYTITQNRKFSIAQTNENGEADDKEISEFLQDIFDSYYTEFILNFGGQNLVEVMGE